MPKIIDYPRASLKNCLELAYELDSLGGNSPAELVAEKSGRKEGGAFRALVASAVRFGLINNAKGRLVTTELFREHKLAYSPEDAAMVLRKAFFGVSAFARVYEQFKGKALPLDIFEKVMIREYGVAEVEASRVAGYFVDGAKMAGLYVEDKLVDTTNGNVVVAGDRPQALEATSKTPSAKSANASETYSVRIMGPGIDSEITVNDPDDLEIVQITLRKIQKSLSQMAKNQKPPDGEPSDG